MIGKRLLYLAVLPAAVGGPYLMMDDGWRKSAGEVWDSARSADGPGLDSLTGAFSGGGGAPGFETTSLSAPLTSDGQPAGPQPRLEGPAAIGLEHIFRFDVTPAWVTGNWSRVTAVLAETDLEGLRVPLVTGVNIDDIAGSLTYYFDKQRQLQRISFHGYTGDSRRLATLLATHYKLNPEPNLGAGLYMAKWNGQPLSVLRVSRAAVIRAESPHSQLEVLLEINRPDNYCKLSPAMEQLLAHDRNARRW